MSEPIGQEIMARLEALKAISEAPDMLVRRYLTTKHREALDLVESWIVDAGMSVHVDAIGNIVGRYEGLTPGARALIMGSHLDTVVDAGAFDGMLGVVLPISYVARLHEDARRMPFAIEVIGFADEEGVRFQSTYLGSRAVAGSFDDTVLSNVDPDGISMADAMRNFGLDPGCISAARRHPNDLAAYVEVHIEQGPVLEAHDLPVGVVTTIAGQNRYEIVVTGTAGHAGTVPMDMRQDALAAAAEMILAVEERCVGVPTLVGTVGRISAKPGAVNVIAGDVAFSIDLRAADDRVREDTSQDVERMVQSIANKRGVAVEIRLTHSKESVDANPSIRAQLCAAVAAEGIQVLELPSGAGHDAAAMADLTAMGMLFVRCEGGISHNPAENMTGDDAAVAARVLARFVENFSKEAIA